MYAKGTSTIKRLIKKLDTEDDITWNDSDKMYKIFLSSYSSLNLRLLDWCEAV